MQITTLFTTLSTALFTTWFAKLLAILLLLITEINGQLATVCYPEAGGYNASKIPCCGWPKVIDSRVTISKSPGAGGAPSPCETISNICVDPCRLAPSPMVFEKDERFMMNFLRNFRWDIYCPRYNWFFDPRIRLGETPCQIFKYLNSGIDVTVFAPESLIPICTTTRNFEELSVFQMMNANNCTSIQSENYLITKRIVAYGLNLISGCGQMRTVVLSKATDEFPPGYTYRLVRNPLRNECITTSTESSSYSSTSSRSNSSSSSS